MNDGGRHIRGMLVLLTCLANEVSPSDEFFSLAVAMEFLQTAFLIQDDVIDMEKKRRGRDAVHISLQNNYNNKIFCDTAAYILGTLGVTYASRLINIKNDKFKKNVKEIFFEMIFDTIQGESFDIVFPLIDMNSIGNFIKVDERIKLAEYIAELKTAIYSFEAPLRMGNILCGGNDKVDWFREFGKELGIAFQISNDLDALEKIIKNNNDNYMADVNPYRITTLNAKAFEENDNLFELVYNLRNNPESIKDIRKIFVEQSTYFKDELSKNIEGHLKGAINSLEDCNCPFKNKEPLKKYIEGLF